jgi:large subunit ribosomal protein L25
LLLYFDSVALDDDQIRQAPAAHVWTTTIMSETILNATTGRQTGSPSTRRLRAEGRVPGVVYGQGMEPLIVSVDRRELRGAVSGTAGLNTILDLTIDGQMYPSIIKDVQRHPVRLNIEHLDFIQVNLTDEIVVQVKIRLEGEAKEVEANSGLIDQIMTEVDVSTTPRNIPDEIVFDVSDMDMDTTITVSDLAMPAGVIATGDPDAAVVTVSIMRTPVLDAEADAAAAAAAAEGEEAAGEEAAAESGE